MNGKRLCILAFIAWILLLTALGLLRGCGLIETRDLVEILVLGILVSVTGWYAWWTMRLARQQESEQSARLRPWLTLKAGSLEEPSCNIELHEEGSPAVQWLSVCTWIENVGILPARNVRLFFRCWITKSDTEYITEDAIIDSSPETEGYFGIIFPGCRAVAESDNAPQLPSPDPGYRVFFVFRIEYEGVDRQPYRTEDIRFVDITEKEFRQVSESDEPVSLPVWLGPGDVFP